MLEPCLSHCTQNWILFQKLFQYSLLKSSQASYLPASPAMVDQRFVYSQDLVHCCGVCCLGGRLFASGFQRIWQSLSQMCSHKISWKTHNLSPEPQEHTLSTPQIMQVRAHARECMRAKATDSRNKFAQAAQRQYTTILTSEGKSRRCSES
jgi:hypothetical protein